MKIKQTEKIKLEEDFGLGKASISIEEADNFCGLSASTYSLKVTPLEFLKKAHKTLGEMIEKVEDGAVDIKKPERKWYQFWKIWQNK